MSLTSSTRNPAAGHSDLVTLSEPLLIDAEQVGHLLGWSERTTRRKDSAGLIPRPVRCGGAVRWRRAEIIEWVESGCPDRSKWEREHRASK